MRRWHCPREHAIMQRRLKLAREGRFSVQSLGRYRKRHPFDCGRPRCGLCSGEKVYGVKARRARRVREIEFELSASG